MSDQFNPYSPPASSSSLDLEARRINFKQIILRWEKSRLKYNLILLSVGLIASIVWMANGMPLDAAITGSFIFGIGANICFCLGHIIEVTLWLFTGRNTDFELFQKVLFWLGTGFSVLFIILIASAPFFFSTF